MKISGSWSDLWRYPAPFHRKVLIWHIVSNVTQGTKNKIKSKNFLYNIYSHGNWRKIYYYPDAGSGDAPKVNPIPHDIRVFLLVRDRLHEAEHLVPYLAGVPGLFQTYR